MFRFLHKRFRTTFTTALVVLGLFLLAGVAPRPLPAAGCQPAITVTNSADSGPGTLRQALTDLCAGGVITFALPLPDTIALHSTLTIAQSMTINGPDEGVLTISGEGQQRVLIVTGGLVVNLDRLTVANGALWGEGGGIFSQNSQLNLTNMVFDNNQATFGGGLSNSGGAVTIANSLFRHNQTGDADGGALDTYGGSVTLINTTFDQNHAGRRGGAISAANNAVLSIRRSVFTQNSTESEGGGAISAYGGSVTIDRTQFQSNIAGGDGGGILAVGGSYMITGSTIAGNMGYRGGAIMLFPGSLTLQNSTISGNTADLLGSGLYVGEGDAHIFDSTIAGQGAVGSAVYLVNGGAEFRNTVLDNNVENCGGFQSPQSLGHNMSSDSSCGFNQPTDFNNTDPLLGPLQNAGGPTLTHPLTALSPAIDAGDNANCPATDQRGVPRPQENGCDMGAYEASKAFQIVKQASHASATPGQTVVYRIVIKNTGLPITTTSAIVTDPLTPDLRFIGPATLTPHQRDAVLAQNEWDLPTLGSHLTITPNATITLTFPAYVRSGTPYGTNIVNTASVTSSEIIGSSSDAAAVLVCNAAYTVTSAADSGNGSLRQAIERACPNAPIDFNLGGPGVITLTSGQLMVTKPLHIHGPGSDQLAISGNGSQTIFVMAEPASGSVIEGLALRDSGVNDGLIYSRADLTINNVVFGHMSGYAIYQERNALTVNHSLFLGDPNAGSSGGIYNNIHGITILNDSVITGMHVSPVGAALVNNFGTVIVRRSLIDGNYSSISGGGIYNRGFLHFEDSILSNNSTGGHGGGLYNNGGTLFMTGATVSGNQATDWGGGIISGLFNHATIENSTIAGNQAPSGGGLVNFDEGNMALTNVTFAGNLAPIGAAIYNVLGTVNLAKIIVDGVHESNCAGAINSQGYNLDSGSSCGLAGMGDLSDTPALLGSLQDNGGATWTISPLPGSPVVDAGGSGCPLTDQRGVARPQGAACDMGALEVAEVIAAWDITSLWRGGQTGTRRTDLLADGRFIDSKSYTGAWDILPGSPARLILSYDIGEDCAQLLLGVIPDANNASGLQFCRDGSGLPGLWQGTRR